MKKLKQIVTAIVVSVALCLSPIVPTFAAEEVHYSNLADLKYMDNGTLFDPLYYANENPDVVKAIYNSTLKVTEAQLYQHYKSAGKQEGRLPTTLKKQIRCSQSLQRKMLTLLVEFPTTLTLLISSISKLVEMESS